jgi:hypothetical protein
MQATLVRLWMLGQRTSVWSPWLALVNGDKIYGNWLYSTGTLMTPLTGAECPSQKFLFTVDTFGKKGEPKHQCTIAALKFDDGDKLFRKSFLLFSM